MPERNPSRRQSRFRWATDETLWDQVPKSQQSRCQALLSQLLRSVAQADPVERNEADEREDS